MRLFWLGRVVGRAPGSLAFVGWLGVLSLPAGCGQPDACKMAPDPGDCGAVFTRYYYDADQDECLPFEWTGCGDVPFDTILECEATCQ